MLACALKHNVKASPPSHIYASFAYKQFQINHEPNGKCIEELIQDSG